MGDDGWLAGHITACRGALIGAESVMLSNVTISSFAFIEDRLRRHAFDASPAAQPLVQWNPADTADTRVAAGMLSARLCTVATGRWHWGHLSHIPRRVRTAAGLHGRRTAFAQGHEGVRVT
jgi:hypothetical protein